MIKAGELCTGCGACEQICPVGAIKLQENNEGFLYPAIDENLCINCNKCEKVCQIDNAEKVIFKSKRVYYAAFKKNVEERIQSSSGGVADAIAKYITANGGYFCGAAWINGELKHIITQNYDDFKYMRGSKYFQSKIGTCYKDIEKLLKEEKTVAFIGTPCQVAGLKLYLNKDYKNLYTIDLICHGVPPEKAFQKFLDDNNLGAARENGIILTFRDGGWKDFHLSIRHGDKLVFSCNKNNSFFKGFIDFLYMRKSCYKCQFAKTERCADMTIGDYWGVHRLDKKLDDNTGCSLVTVNPNGGGYLLLNKLKDVLFLKKSKEKYSIQPNLKYPSIKHPNRENFFKRFTTENINDLISNLMNKDNNIAILNFHFTNYNYGALLTAYASNKYLNDLGYNAFNINFCHKKNPDDYYSDFEEFRNKYLPMTEKYNNADELECLNNWFSTFIVGSDQVFSHDWVNQYPDIYYFKFVNDINKKIAYSASFGYKDFNTDDYTKNIISILLGRFNDIGVREKSGVDICKSLNAKAVHVVDSVFLLDKKDWENISSGNKPATPIVHYILAHGNQKLKKELSNYTSLFFEDKVKVEDWISYIQNAEYIVTNSFHGVCFCIIFNKQFVFVSETENDERVRSLFEMLQIPDIFYVTGDNTLNLEKQMKNKLNYEEINKVLEQKVEESKRFLHNALKRDNEKAYDTYGYFHNEMRKNLKRKLKNKYLFYKLTSAVSFGKAKKRYKKKRNIYKILSQSIRIN